jgi:hypothetical protein
MKIDTPTNMIPDVIEPKNNAGRMTIREPKKNPWDKISSGNLVLNLRGGTE